MTPDNEIDRILAAEDEIVPSSGFAASVMDAVQREAAAPAPIPFPWKYAWPGLAAAGVALVLAVVAMSTTPGAATPAQFERSTSAVASLFERGIAGDGRWVAIALVLTYASVRMSKWLSRRPSSVLG